MTKTPEQIQSELAQFMGSDTLASYGRGAYITEGVKFLADECGAYWLLDIIISHQLYLKVRNEEFQVWRLTVNDDRTAVVIADDGNDNEITQQRVPFTDFPLNGIKLYFENGVLMLPGER